MGFSVEGLTPEFSENYITVRKASECTGYNQQYLRRMLREGSDSINSSYINGEKFKKDGGYPVSF
jgi:hypothetical protein